MLFRLGHTVCYVIPEAATKQLIPAEFTECFDALSKRKHTGAGLEKTSPLAMV